MNIKSLLLGSAAALVAVSGARAADAIVIAEPEPVEYVRICDAYGAGFFYIPGTETCLKFDGYVRYQINTNENGYLTGYDPVTDAAIFEDGFRKNVRGRLNVDARSDTEWGTLRAYLRIQADTGGANADASYGMDQAVIQLGGLYMGYTESAWAAPWGLPGISRFGIFHTDQGGSYAYQQRHQIGYTFSGGNGLFGSIVLEEDTTNGEGYMPDVVGVLGVSQGWGGAWAKVAYDESAEAFNAMIGVHYNIPNMAGSSFRAGAFYAEDPNAYALSMPIAGQAEWSVAVAYHQQFNAQWGAEIGAQYFNGFSDTDGYQVEAAAVWVPVTNFEVRLEGHYYNQDRAPGLDEDNWDGFLRFTRYF